MAMPSEEAKKSSINIDVGASAKVGLEFKGEVPTSSLGHLVDSITDIIRPFSEARGLKADLLRLQREDVLYEIARKAANRISFSGGPTNPIPLKVIVPMLEKASLEENNSSMIEWWSQLLASTAQDPGVQHPIYSDLLSRMTAAEAAYLERMITTSNPDILDIKELDIEAIFNNEVFQKLDELIDRQGENQENWSYEEAAKEAFEEFRLIVERNACAVISLGFPAGYFRFSRDVHQNFHPYSRSFLDVIDVLQAIGVTKMVYLSLPVPAPYIGEFQCSAEIVSLTTLGRKLLRACLSK